MLAFAGALVLSDAFDEVLYALFGWRATLLPGVPIARVPLLTVFVAAGLLLAGNLRGAADHIRAAWLLWPAVALALLSAIWSEQPGTTLLWASALLAARPSPTAPSSLSTQGFPYGVDRLARGCDCEIAIQELGEGQIPQASNGQSRGR